MQRIVVIAMGKTSGFYTTGVEEYKKRMQRLCRFELMELQEEALDEQHASEAAVRTALEKEGARILAGIPKGALVVALCVEGKQLTTEKFSAILDDAACRGVPSVCFVIGSSHGLADAVKQRADIKLSLSAMTLPEQLARLVLAEQVYRALMIRAGSRYHK